MTSFTNRKFLRFWFPVILYSGIIFGVSSWPDLQAPSLGNIPFDKVCHILEYTLYGFLVARALLRTKGDWSRKGILFLTVMISFFYGVSDELHQIFVSGRTSSLTDLMADVMGAFIGGKIYFRKRDKQSLNASLGREDI